MKNLFVLRPLHTDLAILLLRLIFGGLFVYYGYFKISSYHEMLAMFGDPIGLGPKLSLNLVIFAELFCGAFVVLGFVTRLSVIPIFITMIVVFFVSHKGQAFEMKQLPFLYMLLCFVVFILGSGKFSIDALLFRKYRE